MTRPTAELLLHQLLGCEWGRAIYTADDLARCTERATQRFALHGANGPALVQVCDRHKARLYAETDPHEGELTSEHIPTAPTEES